MGSIRSEDTLIFNALSPDISNMSIFYEALEAFFSAKKVEDPSDRFNLIVFEETGPNYFEDFTLNTEHIMLVMKSLEPALVRANVAGGIMVGITFVIDVFKRISEKCFRMIIFTDSGSLRIPEAYIPALEGLIDRVTDMPLFIDIIRIGIDDPREDLKLMKLARRTGGDIHEIKDIKELPSILDKLAKKKEITTRWLVDEDVIEIPEQNRMFIENLAEDPFPIMEEETCAICFKKDNQGLVQCPRCETIAHKACWANWARVSKVGVHYVFRCHQCYNLLILDQGFVEAVQAGQTPLVEAHQVKVMDLQTYQESLETEDGPQIIQVEDPLAMPTGEYEDYEDLIIEFDDEEEEIVVEQDEIFTAKADDELKIIWCPNCSKITTNEYRVCPSCNFPLDDV
ncbi:MAG: hypothetical protein ACTSR8_08030 [Promethearchaeota archaeon]